MSATTVARRTARPLRLPLRLQGAIVGWAPLAVGVIVTLPLLPAKWYRAELARRYRLLDSNAVDNWLGRDSTVKLITKRSYDQNRPVIRSPFFALDSTAKN